MNAIDWFYLRRPLIIFVASIVIAVLLALAGMQFEKAQQKEYDKAVSTLRSTHRLYRNIVNDIDLLDQYRSLYNDYKSTGLVGEERRLSWIESLESTNNVLRLPILTYNLRPQEDFKRPKLSAMGGVEVQSSPMELNMGLLHEEDLFALLEGLRQSIKNLFTVDECSINRSRGINQSLDTKNANLSGSCTIRWVTINAK